jgi:hypothetical protein
LCTSGGTSIRETEIERADLETIVADLMWGQFNDPIRIVVFNILEHWADDISEEVPGEILDRFDIEGIGVPENMRDFVASHTSRARKLGLRLASCAE